jgi:hypothetical protein
MAEPLTSTGGGRCRRPIRRNDRARRPQPRSENAAAPLSRPQTAGDRLAREIDDGIDRTIAGNLIEARHQAERRPQCRCLGGIAREHGDLVARARERLREAAADETRRAGDQHVPPDVWRRALQRPYELGCIVDHDAASRNPAI